MHASKFDHAVCGCYSKFFVAALCNGQTEITTQPGYLSGRLVVRFTYTYLHVYAPLFQCCLPA